MNDTQLTKSFWLSEFVASETATRLGIDNAPPADVVAAITNVLAPGMQAVRDLLGVPVLVTSAYRCPELNAAVHGASSSQHLTGHACDFRAPGFGSPQQVARLLVEQMKGLRWDQLIYEGTWVHISFSPRPRFEALTAHFAGGRVTYTQGIA